MVRRLQAPEKTPGESGGAVRILDAATRGELFRTRLSVDASSTADGPCTASDGGGQALSKFGQRQVILEYVLPEAQEARIAVCDVLGRRIATLVEGGRKRLASIGQRSRLEGLQAGCTSHGCGPAVSRKLGA